MKPASRKKAVITSMAMVTPMTGPTAWAYTPQLRPNSNVITVPATTPRPKPTAKIFFQNRKICRYRGFPVRT